MQSRTSLLCAFPRRTSSPVLFSRTPRGSSCSPESGDRGLPRELTGRLPHYKFRGLLGVHVIYGLFAGPPSGPFIEGFGSFVTSTTAPIATGWSNSCRVGIAPTEEKGLGTAHNVPFVCPPPLFALPLFALSSRNPLYLSFPLPRMLSTHSEIREDSSAVSLDDTIDCAVASSASVRKTISRRSGLQNCSVAANSKL